jgi:hypothetical protein
MGNKEELHELKFSTWIAPVNLATPTATVAAVVNVDTQNYESTLFVLDLGVIAADVNWVIQVWDADAAGAEGASGAAVCVPNDVIFAVSDNSALVAAKYVEVANTSQTLTLSAAADGGRAVMFAYKGSKRYARLHITSAGDKAGLAGVTVIQGHTRYQGRGGIHTVP